MTIFVVEEPIDASTGVVWTFLSEPQLMASWLPGADRLETRDGGPVIAGSELVLHSGEETQTMQVVDLAVGQRIILRTRQGSFTVTYHYGLASDGDGSIAKLKVDCTVRGVAWLFAPLIKVMLRSADRGQLKLLKARVEAVPASA